MDTTISLAMKYLCQEGKREIAFFIERKKSRTTEKEVESVIYRNSWRVSLI
jgi:DNA-binding LacI/PurR family transcriptional regulator